MTAAVDAQDAQHNAMFKKSFISENQRKLHVHKVYVDLNVLAAQL